MPAHPPTPVAAPLAQYAELVVSVARKTDAQLWPSLFAAVGSPAALGEGLRAAGDLQVGAADATGDSNAYRCQSPQQQQ